MCELFIEVMSVIILVYDVVSLIFCEVLVIVMGKVFFYFFGSKELELREEKFEYIILFYFFEKIYLG